MQEHNKFTIVKSFNVAMSIGYILFGLTPFLLPKIINLVYVASLAGWSIVACVVNYLAVGSFEKHLPLFNDYVNKCMDKCTCGCGDPDFKKDKG